MNRSRIEWCDHTWNPITGCRHDCPYCYARNMTKRFAGDVRWNKAQKEQYSTKGDLYVLEKAFVNSTGNTLVYPFGFAPTLHRYRFDILDKLKCGNNVFVGAMADIFGEWVPDSWIDMVMNECVKHDIHNYLFLTKNPDRYIQLQEKGRLPTADNFWYGTTITGPGMYRPLAGKGIHWFVSAEPLLEPLAEFGKAGLPEWVIIGAETGNRKNKVVPDKGWILELTTLMKAQGVPVFMKDSLIPIVGETQMLREFPVQLQGKKVSPKIKGRLEGDCCKCKSHFKKNEMIALCARSQRGEQPKQYAHICKSCFIEHCQEYGIEVPELAAFKAV